MDQNNKPELTEEKKINKLIKRKTVFSFAVFFSFFAVIICLWVWLGDQPKENELPIPLRKILNTNEKINNAFFSAQHLAKEYPKEKAAKEARVNGDIGMGDDFDPESWSLSINKKSFYKKDSIFKLNLADIINLPKRDVIFDFKCIEGWSQISHWSGVRFSDFLARYHLGTHSGNAPDPQHPEDLYKYVALITPDSEYYVGIDMKSMMHPQTLLCYELNEKPLPMNQGYPLRLIITVKYGIKSLKRIGYIYFSDSRPADYWYERGYDYDSAL
jgi:hypothetical protein